MLNLDYRDARPIYEQVRDGLRRLMVTGVIREGEKLPCACPGQQSCHQPQHHPAGLRVPGGGGLCLFYPWEGQLRGPRTGVDEERRDRLLRQFDSLTAELLYLGVTRDRLIARIREKGGEVQ